MNEKQEKILIVYTGGTIGMKKDEATGALTPFNFGAIEQEVPELQRFDVGINAITFDPPIDSADVHPSHWVRLGRTIRDNYAAYAGFVVLHGTDTMAYTASALSFMLENLDKPVIFTGSQIPIGVLRTDGRENLITAIEIASARQSGLPVISEVCIYFQDKLFRANRTIKYNADHFNAFRSENYPPLAEAGIEIHYNYPYIRRRDSFSASLRLSDTLCEEVTILDLFPGITEKQVRAHLSVPGLKGVILRSYGSGNAPTGAWLLAPLREAVQKGIVILNVTQCPAGSVNMEIYETGRRLRDAGVISGHDITTEAAVTKMMYLLGAGLPAAEIRNALSGSVRGELSLRPQHLK